MAVKSVKSQAIGFAVFLLVCHSAAMIGALASVNASSFYDQLTRPLWSPPAWLFGPVWFVLYSLMGISVWLVWRNSIGRYGDFAVKIFLIHLIPNALWSWLFFSWQLGSVSFGVIVLLGTMILISVVMFWRISILGACLLIPYLVWVSYATALNFSLWLNNPELL